MTTDTAIAQVEETTDFAPSSDADAGAYIKTSLGFLALSLIVGLIVAVQVVEPGFLGGVAALSYGRLQPAFTHLFLSGWLTIGLIGALLFVVPRATRTEPAVGRSASLAGVSLLTVGVLAGAVGILFGFSEGRRYLDAPLWADVVVLLGLLAAARPVISVVRAGDERDLGVVQWYAGGGFTWLILAHVVGNIPGLTGTAVELQTAFYRSSLIGLWLGAASVAIVFYLAPRLTGRRAAKGTRLSVLGFWSLAFVWAMTSPAELTFTAVGDWVETIGIVFAIGMLVPVLVIFADLVVAVRGRLDEVTERVTLRFVFAGAIAFALIPIFTLVHAFRSSASVVLFTDWISATELLVFGAITMWLMALIRFAAQKDDGLGSRLHYIATVLGLVTAVGAGAFAGVQTGFEWAGAANSRVFANAGDGFVNTIRATQGPRAVFLVGFALFAVAQLVAVARLLGSDFARPEPALEAAAEPELDLVPVKPLGVNKLRVGAVGLFVAALLLVVVLPAYESEQRDPTILADFARNYEPGTPAADGREIYISEGCQTCHTQVVRANITDVGLGPVAVGGDYVREVPPVLGWQRVGPDLMHVGLRSVNDAVVDELEARGVASLDDLSADERLAVLRLADERAFDSLRSHLADPRASRSWSTMPSYDHLTGADLDRLTEYLMTLK